MKLLCWLGIHTWVNYDETDNWFPIDTRCCHCNKKYILKWWNEPGFDWGPYLIFVLFGAALVLFGGFK